MKSSSLIVSVVLIVALGVALVQCMDHHKFKKCAEKGFCNRLRGKGGETGKQSHYIIESSPQIDDSKTTLTAKLVDKKNIFNGDLLLVVNLYENDLFRVRVREWTHNGLKDTVKQRYEVQDVLTGNVVVKPFHSSSTSNKLVSGNVELVIDNGNENQPFRVTLKVDGRESVVVNGDKLLNVESVFVKEREDQKPKQEQKQVEHQEHEGGEQQEDQQQQPPAEPHYDGEYAIGLDFTFPNSQHVYGIPERATNLALKSTKDTEPYRLFNLDIFEYELDNPIGLYGIIPLLYSIQKGGFASGILFLNPSETFVDIEHTSTDVKSHWISETGLVDVFLLPGSTPHKVLQQLLFLTGYAPIPQLFATAYHQCRWNYKDEDDVLTVDQKFDEHNIPYDVLWLDIEHTDSKKYFTWDKHLFPTPAKMQDSLSAKGRKMVTISDPHIKRANGYHVHEEATKNGYYVKKADGSDYEGHCWPGSSSWLDYWNPEVRKFYAGLFAFNKYEGSTKSLYTWIDMNEPSVFSGPEITMDKDAVHHGGLEHRQVHNMYGFYQSMATYDGHVSRRDGQDRPFVLTRSFFSGSQRYVAVWTGDNAALWPHLDKAQPMLLALGISGMSFVGADVGGFFGNPEEKLLVRWYQAGAFYPFFRAHAHIETQRREPWLFGEENTNLIRAAIQRRYTLLPYYYTLHFHNSVNGAPVMRPLFFEYPQDEQTYDIQNQFLIGKNILIKPVVEANTESLSVYLPPSDIWYDYEDLTLASSTVATPMNKIPVFQRGGSIIPTKMRMRRSSSQMTNDPYTLRIALNKNQQAFGDLYVDDGHSFDYKKGQYLYLTLSFNKNELSCQRGDVASITTDKYSDRSAPSKSYTINNTIERIIIAGYPTKPNKIVLTLDADANANPITPEAIVVQSELEFNYDANTKKLTIRKPLARIDSKWSIRFQ